MPKQLKFAGVFVIRHGIIDFRWYYGILTVRLNPRPALAVQYINFHINFSLPELPMR